MRQRHAGNRTRYWLVTAALLVVLAILLVVVVTSVRNRHTLTFVDDFNGPAGTGPDTSKWTYDIGGGGWGNDELQTYTNSRLNSFLDGNGNLVIRATKHNDTYQSARLTTAGHFSQRYGHWEARMKINSQLGLWPAWWMLGNNFGTAGWPRCGEVDMVEDYGFSAVESSVHTGLHPESVKTYSGGTGNDTEFHIFAMDWTPDGITYLRDGVPYANYKWNSPGGPNNPPQPMFMLLNLAVGGKVGDPPADASFPVDLVIDYVRVW